MKSQSGYCPGCRTKGADATPSDNWLYEAETYFLKNRFQQVEAELQDRLEHLETETANQADWLEIEEESLELHKREMAILDELLHEPSRMKHTLQCILGRRLRRLNQEVMSLARAVEEKGSYDATYWRAERERQITEEILNKWWNWLGRMIESQQQEGQA